MSTAAIIALMLVLSPRTPTARLEQHARAIAAATSDDAEAVALIVTDFAETSFRPGRVPFGATGMRGIATATLPEVAVWVVGSFHRAQRQPSCRGWANVFSFYVTGSCAVSAEAARRGRTMRRLQSIE